MTIRELLTTNPFIVEVYITLRGDYVNGMYHKHQFVHEYGIGTCATFGNAAIMCQYQEGVRSKIFKTAGTLLNREINRRASVPVWDIKEKSLPDFLLDLEVGYWNTQAATQWIRRQACVVGYESACTIKIDVYLPENMEKLSIGRHTEVLHD